MAAILAASSCFGCQEGHPAYKKLGVGLLVSIDLIEAFSFSCHHHLRHS